MKSFIHKILNHFPGLSFRLKRIYCFFSGKPYSVFPRRLNKEASQLKRVLYSTDWNSSYSLTGIHHTLEKEFAAYIGTDYAVAVNTGGMAIQMILRALAIKPGDEIIHQVDTCVANAFAIMNSFACPVFCDIDKQTFMLDKNDLPNVLSPRTRAIMPVHIWGNPEDVDMVKGFAAENGLLVIEDACLALGAEWRHRKVGSLASAAAFSLGCMKPIQAGEGGMITTNDTALAKELRIIRDWGETTREPNIRDHRTLSWNGRMSEFVAAVALEQLRGYPSILSRLIDNVNMFSQYLNRRQGVQVQRSGTAQAFTQVVLKMEESICGFSKMDAMVHLSEAGIGVWHANFEPINSLEFFSSNEWKTWAQKGDLDFLSSNYNRIYSNSLEVFMKRGFGINRVHFLDKRGTQQVIKECDKLFSGNYVKQDPA